MAEVLFLSVDFSKLESKSFSLIIYIYYLCILVFKIIIINIPQFVQILLVDISDTRVYYYVRIQNNNKYADTE